MCGKARGPRQGQQNRVEVAKKMELFDLGWLARELRSGVVVNHTKDKVVVFPGLGGELRLPAGAKVYALRPPVAIQKKEGTANRGELITMPSRTNETKDSPSRKRERTSFRRDIDPGA
jgi:hypothetical protein